MHKKLHKDLYLKRNKTRTYPLLNQNVDNNLEKTFVNDIKNNTLRTLSAFIISGLIIFGYTAVINTQENENNLVTVTPTDAISDNISSPTTFITTNTTSSTSTSTTINSTTTSTISTSTTTISTTTSTLPRLTYSLEIENAQQKLRTRN